MTNRKARPKSGTTLGLLRSLSKETAESISYLTPALIDLSTRPSDILFGLVGFGGGTSAAFLLSVYNSNANAGFGALAFGILGAPLAMLLSRGFTYIKLERRIKSCELILSNSFRRLENMRDGPPDLYELALRDHQKLAQKLEYNVVSLLTGPSEPEKISEENKNLLTEKSNSAGLLTNQNSGT